MGYLKKTITLVAISATLSTVTLHAGKSSKNAQRTEIVKVGDYKGEISSTPKRVKTKRWVQHSQIQGSDKITALFPTQPSLIFKKVTRAQSKWDMMTTWAKEKNVVHGVSTPKSPLAIQDSQEFFHQYAANMLTSKNKLRYSKIFTVNDMPTMDLSIYDKKTKLIYDVRLIISDQTFYELFTVRKHKKGDRKRIHHHYFMSNVTIDKVASENIPPSGQIVILPSVSAPEETLDVETNEEVRVSEGTATETPIVNKEIGITASNESAVTQEDSSAGFVFEDIFDDQPIESLASEG
jgi:hypothetical protein